jgi:hypothetical protein
VYNLIIDPKTTLIFVKVLRNKTELTLEYTLNQGSDVVINNAIDVAAHVAKNQANFEIINDKIKTQDRNHIAQFKNKISQSVSR